MIETLKNKLGQQAIRYYLKDGGIAIPLPNNFGVLEFHELPDDDDILLLAGEDWHTHSSIENGIEEIFSLILDILEGKYILIKETTSEGEVKRRIESDLNEYLKWLPSGYTYEICKKAYQKNEVDA